MNLSSPLPQEGVKVPLYAAFAGLKGVPLLALGTNSYSPLLRLYEDELELKVFKTHRKCYAQIERIEVFQMVLTNNIIFNWKDSAWSFSGNVTREDWLIQVVDFFKSKNIALAPSAENLLKKSAP